MNRPHRFSTLWRLILAAAAGQTLAPAAPSPGPHLREFLVPPQHLAKVLEASPKAVLLTAGQFAALLRDSLPRPSGPQMAPPAPAVLRSAHYTATPGDLFVTIRGKFTVECLTDSWVEVPLALDPQWLGSVKLDGEAAVKTTAAPGGDVSSTRLVVRGLGCHEVQIDFAVPVKDEAGRRSLEMMAPSAAEATLTMNIPGKATLESSEPFTQKDNTALFALPAEARLFRVTWSKQDLAPLESAAILQDFRIRYSLDPVRLESGLEIGWHSPLRPLPPQLVLPLPEASTVLSVDGPEIRQWSLAGNNLVIDFLSGDRTDASLILKLERSLALSEEAGPVKLVLPAPVALGVPRASGQFTLFTTGGLRVRRVDAGPLAEREDAGKTAEEMAGGADTWVFPVLAAPPEIEVEPLSVQFAATLDTQISLTREAVRLKRWLTLTPRDGTLFSPRLEGLVAGEEIDSIALADGSEPAWRASPQGIDFPDNKGIAAGIPWTVIVETRIDPAGWQAMAAQPLNLALGSAKVPGAGKVNGYVALDFEESLQVTTTGSTGLEVRDPRQFTGVLPLTGRMAWSRLEDFRLDLTVARRAPEFEASILMYLLPLGNSLEVEGSLTLKIEHSPLKELRVIFPAEVAASVRWNSPLLSESLLEPDQSWRLRFHQELEGAPSLRFRLGVPLVNATDAGNSPDKLAQEPEERRFAVAAPMPGVAGARRLHGTVMVEANTDTELTFSAAELNALDTLKAPALPGYNPRHRLVSAWTWLGGTPSLTVRGVRHRPGSLVSTVVDTLVLDTVLSQDGPVRHQAQMQVRTAGDQYLDVTLPDGARILTLLVNQAAVKPVRNASGGLRVPLADSWAIIRLICECPGEPMRAAATKSLMPVTFDSALPVMDTRWQLHLPDGFVYSGFDSNLTPAGDRPVAAIPSVLETAWTELNPLSGKIMSGTRSAISDAKWNRSREARFASISKALQEKLKLQEIEVEQERENMLNLMKQHGIVDLSVSYGNGLSSTVRPSDDSYAGSRQNVLAMESQVATLKSQLENLHPLSGEQLIESAMQLNVKDGTIDTFANQYKTDKANYQRLLSSGFGEHHPKVMGLAKQIQEESRILEVAAENFRNSLSINIKNMSDALDGLKGISETKKLDTAGERQQAAEYVQAKGRYESKLDLLNQMRETALKTEVNEMMPGDQKELSEARIFQAQNILDMKNTLSDQPNSIPISRGPRLENAASPSGDTINQGAVVPLPSITAAGMANHVVSVGGEVRGSGEFPLRQGMTLMAAIRRAGGFTDFAQTTAVKLLRENIETVYDLRRMNADGSNNPVLLDGDQIIVPAGGTGESIPLADMPDDTPKPAVASAPGTPIGLLNGSNSATERKFQSAAISDREGILPLDFALPSGGRVYRFDGQYAPGALEFRYESWERRMQWSWVWMMVGGGLFWTLARRSPWFVGALGLLLGQFLPGILGHPEWLPVANALVIGWVAAGLLRLVWWVVRRTGASASKASRVPVGVQLLAILLLADWQGAAIAEEPVGPQDEIPVVVVPYDPGKPMEQALSDQRYLSYETFEKLWSAAKKNRAADAARALAASGAGDRGATLTSALHRAEVDGNLLRVEAVFALQTRGPDWTAVPFVITKGLRSLLLDGAAAALKDGQLLVERAGAHTLTAAYEVPLTAGWEEVSWDVPPATATSLALSLAMSDPARPAVNDGAPVVEAEVAGRRVFTATLGSTARITLKRRTTAERGGHQTEQPPLAIVRTRVYASPSLERVEAALDYRFSGESRDSFTLQMDAGLTPVSFAVPGLESWVLREEGGRQVLELRLERAVQDDFRLSMVAERMVGALPLMEKAPLILAGAGRVELECSVLATDDLKVRPLENAAHQRVDFLKPSGAGDEGFDAIGSWKAAGTADPLRWELSASTPAASAVVRYAFQPGAGKVELSAGMELSPAPGRELRELTIQVPDGSTIQGVTSDRLTDWWHEGRLLHVRLSGGRDGATHVALNLTHPLAAAASAVVFQPLLIHGFDKVSGSGLLIAPVNQEAILQLSPAGPALREVAPQDTQSGFTIRHPFAGKRGFVFEGTAWSATVTLQPLVERYDVDWVMDAEVRDSWTVVNTRILLNLTRGGLERVVFTTPASAPELRATGNDIRETASVVEGALRRYTVSFQTLMTGAVLFTLTGQMPHGGSGLPDIGFPGAARMARFVIVDNKSSGNLTMEAAGLEVTPREQVSFLPAALAQGQSGAQFYAARPDWSLKLGVEKLETTAGHAALVLHAELTTSVLRNGEIWQRAVYVLQNRTLQFLPVRLPEPAVVVSVEVGGETTRADTGVVDGLPVLLIPLIQTAAGELATEVKLISRRRAQSGAFHGVLEDPDLPGLPIGQTFWTIQYPDGYQLEADGGNMTSTDESALSSDKALSWLTELAQLKNIAMSSQYDGMSRITARKNARTLFSKVQSALAPGQEADSAGLLRDLEEALIPAPQTATNLQKDATAEEGAELRAKEFVSNRAGIGPVQPQKQTASAGTGKDLNLNDNVTWNVKTGTDSVQKSQNSAGQPGNRRLSQIDKLGRGKVAGEKRVGDDKQHLGSAEPMANFASQNSAYSFQNGRLNDPGQRVLPDSAKSAQDLTAPAAPMARPSALGASTGSPRADDPLSSKPAQPALNGHLRTSGRSSLAAVFPEQPNALHFKKVKGDAFVKLQLHRPWHQQMDRSAAWALSVGLGALLVLRWLYFRARRQAERCS